VYFQSNGLEPLTNGIRNDVNKATSGVELLTFEEEDDETFYTKDLPAHACS
jgi:hypothetical protein